ncbi:MAG TPA: hypothetical protein VLX58_11060 [Bryobacteraceae bacterium]|nr:hypothetical protein [Bryobacteraceae bacterium]
MRPLVAGALMLALAGLPVPLRSSDKLTYDERVELVRGLMAEYATVKQLLPRSKKPLPYEATGAYDKKQWEQTAKEMGPAARTGDLVQITRVTLEDDRILLEINGGLKSGKHWYDRVQIGMGTQTAPVSNGEIHPTTGTNIEILFHKPLSGVKSADIKKILAPIFDFEKRSATELYAQTLPPAIQKAIADKRVLEGMDRDQVLLAMGHPTHKSRETKEGMELEDWVYGTPPGKITFVTFNGNKVIKVKEAYAGLGAEAAGPEATPR